MGHNVENGSRKFFRPQLNVSSSKIPVHYAEDEYFPPPIPRPLLSAASCDIVIGHGRGRGLGPRSNFALPRVVQSINARGQQ